jgi:tetratricopeptide (TPR) repeat protein
MSQLLVDFVKSSGGMLAAVGTLLGGVAAFLQARRQTGGTKPVTTADKPRHSRSYPRGLAITGVSLILVSLTLFVTRAIAYNERSKNEELTTAAWKALDKGDFREAKAKAQACIREFGPAADREQAERQRQGVPAPPTGKVSEAEANVIFAAGLLNDVATCYFILGKAAEGLGNKREAIEAYKRATTFTYARTWDPKGWFWSPAEGARDRLTSLMQAP